MTIYKYENSLKVIVDALLCNLICFLNVYKFISNMQIAEVCYQI